ncbi:SNF2 family N-terminal domain-containing protein [Mycena leptocephala]|nr:SNF2 family N-terminal domain-containing protein [Mycena leptocephala]
MLKDDSSPAMLLLSGGKELALVAEVYSTELWPWLANDAYRVDWSAAVAKEQLEYPGEWAWMEITLNVYALADLAALYLPRMRWGLSPAERARTMHEAHPPQEPPPLWVLQAWRDHGLLVNSYEDTAWAQHSRPQDPAFLSMSAKALPLYKSEIHGLQTTLMPHQSQAVRWLKAQEKAPKPGVEHVQWWSLWRDGKYRNTLDNGIRPLQADAMVRSVGLGGILADDMGLGKTITMLALILETRGGTAENARRANLVVAPLSVLETWNAEATRHCPSLKKLLYRGSVLQQQVNFHQYDLVITNYETLTRTPALAKVTWKRVILDEAQRIRNPKTLVHQAACKLTAEARWALTATPIINTLHDLAAIVAFLRTCAPLDEMNNWDRFIGAGKKPPRNGAANLQALMQNICLRRTKETLGPDDQPIVKLPTVTYRTISIELGTEQRGIYESTARSGTQNLRDILGEKSHAALAQTMFTVILRLRQIALHPALVRGVLDPAEHDPDVCMVCFEAIGVHDVYRAECLHSLCSRWWVASTRMRNVPVDTPRSQNHSRRPRNQELTTPMRAGQILRQTRSTDGTDRPAGAKRQMFGILGLREIPAARRRLVATKGDTVRALSRRDERGEENTSDCRVPAEDGPRVLLLSLGAGAFGLNLTAANNVFLMDPWWQPAIERQAIDRVNRIGQTKPVNVFRLIAHNTIEHRVIQIQEDKSRIAQLALGGNGGPRSVASDSLLPSSGQIDPGETSDMLRRALELPSAIPGAGGAGRRRGG